jgi:hypothetical protein
MAAAMLLLVGVPLGLVACASQQSATETEQAQKRSAEAKEPAMPEAPPEDAAAQTVVVIRDDSTKRTIRLESDGPIAFDSLGNGTYVLRHDGRVDTLGLPNLGARPDLRGLERDLRPPFAPDSLKRALRLPVNPDSLRSRIRTRIDLDSLERALRARIDPDSIERAARLRVNPDSLERQALRMRLHADSLARWHREHADSLRHHMEQMRERMEREMPDRLREQARRLREQAERLEERADEMNAPAPSDASVRTLGQTDDGTRYAAVGPRRGPAPLLVTPHSQYAAVGYRASTVAVSPGRSTNSLGPTSSVAGCQS